MVIWSRDTNVGPELGEDYPKQELRGCFHEKILNQLRAECLPEGLDGYICNLKKSLHKMKMVKKNHPKKMKVKTAN